MFWFRTAFASRQCNSGWTFINQWVVSRHCSAPRRFGPSSARRSVRGHYRGALDSTTHAVGYLWAAAAAARWTSLTHVVSYQYISNQRQPQRGSVQNYYHVVKTQPQPVLCASLVRCLVLWLVFWGETKTVQCHTIANQQQAYCNTPAPHRSLQMPIISVRSDKCMNYN